MPLPTAYGTIPLGGALPEAYIPVDSVPLLGGALESGYGEVSYAVNMTAAASGSNGITVADDNDIDSGTASFGAHWEGSRDSWRPASAEEIYTKYQDASNYVSLICNTDGTVRLLAVVAGVTILDETSSAAVATTYNGKNLKLTFSCSRETASAAGSFQPYIDAAVLGAAQSITAASPTSISNSGALYIAGTDSKRFASNTISFVMLNFAPTASEVLDLCTNGIPASWKWGSQAAFYTSDFSAGTNGWTASALSSLVGNIDGIGGQDNWLRGTLNATNTAHAMLISNLVIGNKYSITGLCYIPSSNAGAVAISVRDGASVALTSVTTLDAATAFSTGTFTATTDSLRLYARNSVGSTTVSGGGDVMYVKDVLITRLGATMALLPDTIPTSSATTWSDTSGNTGGGTLPAAGATKVTIRK